MTTQSHRLRQGLQIGKIYQKVYGAWIYMKTTLNKLVADSTKRVEEEKHTCYWAADGYKFDNKNLALWYESTTNSFVTYVDSQIDLIRDQLSNTSIDMSKDYNKEYLEYLKSNYDKIHLFFSGGADSLTILETAIKNNIILDNLICQTCDDVNLLCNREIKQCALPVLEKYKGKFGSYEIKPTSWDDHASRYSNELSFFTLPATTIVPLRSCPDGETSYNLKEDVCYLKGTDKPQVVRYNKKWYAVLLDNQSSVNKKNPNVKAFWLDAMNIKSYIKDALLYREYLLSADRVNQTGLQFFKPNQDPNVGNVLDRSKVHNHDMQLLKGLPNTKYHSSKNVQRINDAINNSRMDVLVNYFTAMKKFSELVPKYGHNDGFKSLKSTGKFAWFIDIDSLEVFTQQQLIPDGF